MLRISAVVFISVLLLACGDDGRPTDGAADGAADSSAATGLPDAPSDTGVPDIGADTAPPDGGGDCLAMAASDLPGVRIEMAPDARCRFTVGTQDM